MAQNESAVKDLGTIAKPLHYRPDADNGRVSSTWTKKKISDRVCGYYGGNRADGYVPTKGFVPHSYTFPHPEFRPQVPLPNPDKVNCDEVPFASTYETVGPPATAGGGECIRTVAAKVDDGEDGEHVRIAAQRSGQGRSGEGSESGRCGGGGGEEPGETTVVAGAPPVGDGGGLRQGEVSADHAGGDGQGDQQAVGAWDEREGGGGAAERDQRRGARGHGGAAGEGGIQDAAGGLSGAARRTGDMSRSTAKPRLVRCPERAMAPTCCEVSGRPWSSDTAPTAIRRHTPSARWRRRSPWSRTHLAVASTVMSRVTRPGRPWPSGSRGSDRWRRRGW
jgi:hypothetical protein